MKKILKYYKENIDKKELLISMVIFLFYFTIIAVIMVIKDTWPIFGKEMIIFYSGGLILSFIINIAKQIK